MAEIVDFGLQQHKIKMDSRYFENVLSVVAGDTGRRLEVQLLDTNGMVQDTTGLSLRLNAVIVGKATFTDATLVDAPTGKYQLDLSNGMFLAPGNWQFQWLITDSAGKKLHSFAFTGNIGKNISEGGSQATNFYLNLEDLKKMQDDLMNGTIDSAILETTITEKLTGLETQYAPKLTEVTAQLAQTVRVDGSGQVTYANLSQEVREQFTGGNTAIVGKDAVITETITDNAVTGDKIDGATSVYTPTSVNLFNKKTVEQGGYYGRSDGVWVTSYQYVSSDFIPVEYLKQYSFSNSHTHLTYWDENYNFVNGVLRDSRPSYQIVNQDIKFLKIAILAENINIAMVSEADKLPTGYVPYTELISYKFTKKWNLPESIADGSVAPNKIEGVSKEKIATVNLFNKETVERGGYYGRSNGVWVSTATHDSSDFIPVEYPKQYEYGDGLQSHITFWDENKFFVSGILQGSPFQITRSNIKYMKIQVIKTNLDTQMVTESGKMPEDYIPYYLESNTFDETWNVLSLKDLSRLENIEYEVDDLYSQNYTQPIRMDLKDFSGYNEPYHPSVVYIEGGFAGYKYWMVQTPFPVGAKPYVDRWEVPIVYKSHDGITWETVADPMDDLTADEIANQDYMSDPHILYRKDTQTLEVWYRFTKVTMVNGSKTLPTKVIRKTTMDGVNWSVRENMIDYHLMNDIEFMRSPSIMYDTNLMKYRSWYSNANTTAISKLYYSESEDGKTWSPPVNIMLDIYVDNWHADVAYYHNKYHLLTYYDHSGAMLNAGLVYYVSDDGINFKYQRTLLKPVDGNPLYSGGLYRSVSLLDDVGKVRVYFSGTNQYNKREIGLMVSNSISTMNGVRKIDGNLITMKDGRTLEDLGKQISFLRDKI